MAALTVSARTTEPGWRKACPLVGRDRERQQLRQGIDPLLNRSMGARDRWAKVLLLVGELGIGKTCLLEDLCAQQRQIAVVWGRGFAAEQMRPYGMWMDALRSHPSPPGVSIPQDLGFLLPELTATRAELAQRTAHTLNHPSEITLASALGIQSALACGERSRAATDWTALLQQCDRPNLSALARTLLDQVQSAIEC